MLTPPMYLSMIFWWIGTSETTVIHATTLTHIRCISTLGDALDFDIPLHLLFESYQAKSDNHASLNKYT